MGIPKAGCLDSPKVIGKVDCLERPRGVEDGKVDGWALGRRRRRWNRSECMRCDEMVVTGR
jgi:hypothetical protein